MNYWTSFQENWSGSGDAPHPDRGLLVQTKMPGRQLGTGIRAFGLLATGVRNLEKLRVVGRAEWCVGSELTRGLKGAGEGSACFLIEEIQAQPDENS